MGACFAVTNLNVGVSLSGISSMHNVSYFKKYCLLIFATFVAFIGLLFARPDLILPHKIHAAVSLKGWDGFSKVVVANIAQRKLGQRTTKSREAWYRLLGSLRDIDVEYLSPRSDVVTATEVAQGHEFVLHLLSIGLDAYVINADTTRPKFKNLFNPDHKWLVDQPDAIYLTATISADYDYIIEGSKANNDHVYFSYTCYTHKKGGGWAENIFSEAGYPRSSVSGRQLKLDKDGKYRLLVSKIKPTLLQDNEQWLRIPESNTVGAGEVSILARHYFEGATSIQMYQGRARSDVSAKITVVENIHDATRSRFPPIPTDDNVAQRIDFLSNFLLDHTIVMGPGGEMTRRPGHTIPKWYSIVNNVIGKPGKFIGSSSGAGAPDVDYAAGPWKLTQSQALIIEGVWPAKNSCIFANVLLLNKFMQSLDYHHGRAQHYNRRQTKGTPLIEDEGPLPFKLVLAHENPGDQYHWLDTEGRETGIIFFRYFLLTAEVEQVTSRVVEFASL